MTDYYTTVEKYFQVSDSYLGGLVCSSPPSLSVTASLWLQVRPGGGGGGVALSVSRPDDQWSH